MEPGFGYVAATGALVAFATAGQIAVVRARLRRARWSSTSKEIRQVRLVGPHATKVAAAGLAIFTAGAILYALGTFVGVLMMSLGLVVLGFAVSSAVGLRMVLAGDPSVDSAPRGALRRAGMLAAAVVIAGTALVMGARDEGRLLWLIPMVAFALSGFAIVRAFAAPVAAPVDARGDEGP